MDDFPKGFYLKKEQVDIAKEILRYFDEGYDNIVLEAPTGVGKSAIAYLVHHFSDNLTTNIVCHQKLLQDQYEKLLGDKIVVVKGKDNYRCFVIPDITVSNAPCQFTGTCGVKFACEYYKLRSKFDSDPLVVSNYSLLFSLLDIGRPPTFRDLVIYDEAHNIEDIFTDYSKVRVSSDECEVYDKLSDIIEDDEIKDRLRDLSFSVENFNISKWRDDLDRIFAIKFKLREMLTSLSEDFGDITSLSDSDKKFISRVLTVNNKISDSFCKYNNYRKSLDKFDSKFVYDYKEDDEGFAFELTPIVVSDMVNKKMMELSRKRVFMSAVFPKGIEQRIGINKVARVEVGSPFPVSSRRVVFIPVDYLSNKKLKDPMYDMSRYFKVFENICKYHSEENHSGLVLTSSYEFIKVILAALSDKLENMGYKIITHNPDDREERVREFVANNGTSKYIIFSPSLFEGVDFVGDISRFQIIAKTPFRYLGSNYVREKMNVSREWYEYDALLKVIQGCGRSTRQLEDSSVSYVLDGNALRIYNKYKRNIPKWFVEAVEVVRMRG